jgi:hypothetical protein
MYHQGRIKKNSSTGVVSTYRMNCTFSESVVTDYSGGVYQLKKESKSLKDVTHHHMEDTIGHSVHMQRSSKVDFLANHI